MMRPRFLHSIIVQLLCLFNEDGDEYCEAFSSLTKLPVGGKTDGNSQCYLFATAVDNSTFNIEFQFRVAIAAE